MASVTLQRLYVHDADDLSDFITVLVSDLEETNDVDGEVRAYGSRRRIVTTTVESRQVPYRGRAMATSDVAWLKVRRGHLLLFRDPSGQLVWGTVFGLDVTRRTHGDDCSWTVEEVTASAEV